MAALAGGALVATSNSNRRPSPNRAPQSKGGAPSKGGLEHVRWVAFALSIVLILASLILRLQPQLLPKSSSLASELLGKVGIVTLCIWLAWPAIETMLRAPSGMAFAVASGFAIILFIYRPKTIYITGPFLLVGAGIILIMNWLKTSGKRTGR